MPLGQDAPLGMTNRFALTVDTPTPLELGSWSKVSGLDVTWDIAEYRAGDHGNDRWYQAGNTKYSEVSLSRAACEDSKKIQEFLSTESFEHKGPYTANITLFGADNKTKMVEWELRDFMPKKWSIDGFEGGKSGIAIETFQFTHMGFLKDEVK